MAEGGKSARKGRKQKQSTDHKLPRTSDRKANQAICAICEEEIIDASSQTTGEDAIYCDGHCKSWIHRRCAGLSTANFTVVSQSKDPYFCPHCRLETAVEKLAQLEIKLEHLVDRVERSKPKPTPTTSSSPPIPVHPDNNSVSSNTAPSLPTTTNSSSRETTSQPTTTTAPSAPSKFNVVVYGIEECPKGTHFSQRQLKDTENVANFFETFCPQISDQSIRDTVRLGKFREEAVRPILVTMARVCDASTLLSNRRSIAPSSKASLKPHMSHEQRKVESILLQERRRLIGSGKERSSIKIKGNRLYLHNLEHGRVENNQFVPLSPTPSTSTTTTNETESDQTPNQNDSPNWLPHEHASIALWNARSLKNKLSYFQSLVYSQSIDIFAITESWLSDDIYDLEILPTNYNIYRRDRNARGGGVLLAVSNKLASKISYVSTSIELLSVEITLPSNQTIMFCCMYAPPSSERSYFQDLFHYLQHISNGARVILVGDMNLPDVNWEQMSASSSVSEYYSFVTRCSPSIWYS